MSTATLALRFVFATLLLSSICMAQQWSSSFGGGYGGQRKTNRDENPWDLDGPHPSVFEDNTYTIRFLPKYFKNLIKFAIMWVVSLVTRALPDRHQYLREVADSINGMIDCASHYYNVVLNLFFSIYRFFARIPLLGWVVRLPVSIVRSIIYFPSLLVGFILDFILGIFI